MDWEIFNAGVVELVDTLDLGSSAARCESSSLSARTTGESRLSRVGFFYFGKTMLKQMSFLLYSAKNP